MSYYQKYLCRFKNVEDQQVIVRIEDRFSFNPNPYNLWYEVEDNGDGTQTLIVHWDSIPAGCTGVRVVATTDGFTVFDQATFGTGSPAIWSTLTSGVYIYLLYFTIPVPGDDELFILNELQGVTDELVAAGDPLHLVVNNNSEDKLATIYGMQCIFKFNSDSNNNLSKLLRGSYSDKRYYMTVAINEEDRFVFKGFISLADMQEPFLPHPNVTVLTATDGLGALKNISLKDFNDANPGGKHKLIDYIAWCLRFTGLQENINVVFNVREEDDGIISADPSGHIYNTQYLDAKTFEAEIGESEDCYTVLQKILKHTCFIGQRHGTWWIKNVDEFDDEGDYVAVFNYLGDFTEMKPVAFYIKEIGKDNNMFWSKESCNVSFTSPNKFLKDTFKYNTPKEVPCNVDFARGDLITEISPTEKHFEVECWNLKTAAPPFIANNNEAYIVKKYDTYGTEIERYAEITFDTWLGGSGSFLESSEIPIGMNDRFQWSYDFRWTQNYTSGSGVINVIMCSVRLDADDGTIYFLGDDGKWYASDSTWSVNYKLFYNSWDRDSVDERIWKGFNNPTNEIDPCPKDGKLYFMLHWENDVEFEGYYLQISNFQFTYIPFINGSYQRYIGDYHKVSVAAFNNENTDEEIFVRDSPRKIFKGGLHKYNGSAYVLSGLFWKATKFLLGMPPDEDRHLFGWIQAFNAWNQVRLLCRKLRGSVQGIESSSVDGLWRSDLPSIFHTYYLRDLDEHTNQKKFMCINYDMDLYLCEWVPVFAEVMDESRGKAYNDTYELKYITK